jgi:3-mercaptopyruvate sulfurtransferase SseA
MMPSSTNIAVIIMGSFLIGLCVFLTQDILTVKVLRYSVYQSTVDNSGVVLSADLAEVLQYYNDPKVIFIDARSPRYFSYGSIKNSIDVSSLTEGKVTDGLLDSLKKASEVVVYGSDRNSREADLEFWALIKIGVQNVKVYEAGWAEWKSCKLPMQMSDKMMADQKNYNQ